MNEAAGLLRIYTDEASYFGDRRVYEVIAARARKAGLAGVTVIEALVSAGRSAHTHRHHILESDRGVVIEIIDRKSDLRRFADCLADIPDIPLITLEAVDVLRGSIGSAACDSGDV